MQAPVRHLVKTSVGASLIAAILALTPGATSVAGASGLTNCVDQTRRAACYELV